MSWIYRAQRVCRRCNLQVTQDERHAVFVCPKFGALRATSGLTFPASPVSDEDMLAFMTNSDIRSLAALYTAS